MSALDSSFLVLPFGNDLLLIALISSDRDSMIWIAYVLVSAIGSVLGVFVIDLIMRKTGEKGLEDVLAYIVYGLMAIAIVASSWSLIRWLKRN